MKKQIEYLEEEKEDAVSKLDDTAHGQQMETKEYNRRLAAILIHYNNLIYQLIDENQ